MILLIILFILHFAEAGLWSLRKLNNKTAQRMCDYALSERFLELEKLADRHSWKTANLFCNGNHLITYVIKSRDPDSYLVLKKLIYFGGVRVHDDLILDYAARSCDERKFELLMMNAPTLNLTHTTPFANALQYAASTAGCDQLLSFLVKKGMDPVMKSVKVEDRPLPRAASSCILPNVKMLLNANATMDVDEALVMAMTAFDQSDELQREECGKVIQALCEATPPFAETALETLGTETSCSVCFEDFGPNLKPYRLKCGHCFCKVDVYEWLKISSTCPYCRRNITDTS